MKSTVHETADYVEIKIDGYPFLQRFWKDLSHRNENPDVGDFYLLQNGESFICCEKGKWESWVTNAE